ncbi:predicted protein [Plenodomus lingam JN3]|uniref:Uncharacterized protein n=1 Tax=Leptosphaeria maculans (strain JN3 / isolate v23.1.3 / race Av1-4-5-6-7-8) TaxID=985895 RepID=E4ZGZ6_LEPMJ|nr:predicted protein [Plenodomus lingam JN3]CBX90566.1 predicted protein [Plenodomus lingam JN3]
MRRDTKRHQVMMQNVHRRDLRQGSVPMSGIAGIHGPHTVVTPYMNKFRLMYQIQS